VRLPCPSLEVLEGGLEEAAVRASERCTLLLRVALDEYNYDRMVDPLVVARARTRVLVLRAAYTEAIAKVEAGRQELRDVELPFPDGQHNYRNALIAERAALEAYANAVRDLEALTRRDGPWSAK
jgi:hypothetical protein